MIARITTGGDTGGLMRYLVGPGKENEHTNPHVVTGSADMRVLWGDRVREIDYASAIDIANDLDTNMEATETYPVGKRNQWDKKAESYVESKGANHVWHCSLSLREDMGELGDEAWANIAQDFVSEMGIADGDIRTDCQWIALRHGKSENGNDHIHIVANRVQADGLAWDTYRDFKKASKACTTIEQRYGLEVLESRVNGRGAIHDSANELNMAKRNGQNVTYRAVLETKVRAAASAAESEADFVTQLHAQGLKCRPYFAQGRTDVINGYSVSLPDTEIKDGTNSPWRAGSKISKDLGLRVLRTRWEDTPTSATEAAEAWRSVWNSNKVEWKNRPLTAGELDAQTSAAQVFSDRLKHVDPTDQIQLANASADIAGALAAIAENPDAGRVAWQIRSLSRRVAHNAQLNLRDDSKDVRFRAGKVATRLLMVAAASSSPRTRSAMIVGSVVELVIELAALYRAANQANTAANLERLANESLAHINESYSENPWLAALEREDNLAGTQYQPGDALRRLLDGGAAAANAEPVAVGVSTSVATNAESSAEDTPLMSHDLWLGGLDEQRDETRVRTEQADNQMHTEGEEPVATTREPNPWLDADYEAAPSQSRTPDRDESTSNVELLDSLNPTGTINTEYDPTFRAEAPLAENLVPLSKTEGIDGQEVITIYRGVPSDAGDQINAGDYVTTNPQIASDYAGTGKVIEQQVPAVDVLNDADEPGGEEYIYRPAATEEQPVDSSKTSSETHQVGEALTASEVADALSRDTPVATDAKTIAEPPATTREPNPWLDADWQPPARQSPGEAAEQSSPGQSNQGAGSEHSISNVDEYADDVRQVEPDKQARDALEAWARSRTNTTQNAAAAHALRGLGRTKRGAVRSNTSKPSAAELARRRAEQQRHDQGRSL